MDNPPHCQIRVVPRADEQSSQTVDTESTHVTPIFRSMSLLCPTTVMSNRVRSTLPNPATESLAQAKSFADMARRIGVDIADNEKELVVQSTSLTTSVKLQPNRATGHKVWRPMRADDPVTISGLDYSGENMFSTTENLNKNAISPSYLVPSQNHPSQAYFNSGSVTPTPYGQGAPLVNPTEPVKSPASFLGTSHERNAVAVHSADNDRYNELFGTLPDPIHLHERLGDFEGQVIFIGHPNRDVSAHQWSSNSFMWENIGRYSQIRRKTEGSLASDQARKYGKSNNALIYFKTVAENRERLVAESRRPYHAEGSIGCSNLPQMFDTRETANTMMWPTGGFVDGSRGKTDLEQPSATTLVPSSARVKRELLDDPFLTDKNSLEAVSSGSKSQAVTTKGSLNLDYEFPIKTLALSRPSASTTISVASRERPMQGETEIPTSSWCGMEAVERASQSTLQDVNFSEEASSRRALLDTRRFTSACNENSMRSDISTHDRTANRRHGAFQATARSLFPSVGPTVANPHRGLSHLDYTALAYKKGFSQAVSDGTNESDETTVETADTRALHFSDPDGICQHQQGQEHEIANDLSQQAPTKQNFKGPFFTASKPTAHDPTVSLSLQVSEEEKLQTWFSDGHRPARQREHAMTLVSAAIASDKSQWFETVGASKNSFENTTPFVRLYEGLSEYMEEYRTGGGGSYFSRAWKAAPFPMRDFNADGNYSYFTDPLMVPSRLH